jgi:protein-disulfide isomerase
MAVFKVLGSGCKNCLALEANPRKALALLAARAKVEKVEDYPSILSYGVTTTPALVVGRKVLLAGRVPRPEQLARLIAEYVGT